MPALSEGLFVRVFVVQPVPSEAIAGLRAIAEVETSPYLDRRLTREEIAHGVHTADYVFALGENVLDSEAIKDASRLRMIGVMEIFPTSIDLAAATAAGVPVAGLPHSPEITETTAEFTFALIGALTWRIPQADRFLRAGQWTQYQSMALPADQLRGRTLGIVGLGAIGRGVAARAQAAAMRVLYTDLVPLDPTTERALEVHWREIDVLFTESDIVLISVALTQRTLGLIDAGLLARLRPDGLLVNTSRGRVLQEEALADALESGRLAGAALDVFEHELPDYQPGPHPRLLALPNVILTPHIGTSARQTRAWMARQVADNILRHYRGDRPLNLLNPEVYGDPPLSSERIG